MVAYRVSASTPKNAKTRPVRVGFESTREKVGSAGLAVHSVLAATRAEFLQFETIRRVATVLRRDVVTLLALGACQRDARTDLGALACHWIHLLYSLSIGVRRYL